ncbi:MobF family relaxase [Dyadobacter sp. Leaf189]|uniref:MobF family relaxase n=1 Tax=Dyadobacter sp. Leaf189 TaxID=1736295 RepID=UPI0009EA3860|nr:MobF family relaxase [Dyadobacter sp. Leaf189]
MIQSNSAAQAKAYFSQSLSKADYYVNDQELNGHIQGKLAKRLGLAGRATKETFFALCENVHPFTGEHLTPRTKKERTTGYDINFHCPKSVSILHALSKDDHLLKAFEASVKATMKDIEADAKTRVRKGGRDDDRLTGELLWADFVHQTARPVKGHFPDPHVHAHCFVFNQTWDEQEQKVKAGQFRDIKRDMPYYQARFHKYLSDQLIDLCYGIVRTEKSFEIENVPERVINLFSKRTDEIGRIAKEKAVTDIDELGALGARTRAKKQKGVGMDELKTDWKRQIKELGSEEDGKSERSIRYAPEKLKEAKHAKDCVDHAILHGFERASVIRDRRLLESAYRQGIGDRAISLDAVTTILSNDSRIIGVKDHDQTLLTTEAVLAEEHYMVKLARSGQGRLTPLCIKAPELKLDGQQAAAVSYVLTTTNRVSIIRGAAGSGKTTLMQEAVKHIESAGKTVTVVAPTSQASRGVLKDEGFLGAETVSKLLIDQKMQEELAGQVLWVDEAGLLGTQDMTALLELSIRQNARLILGGDTRQHSAVIRGDALRILNTVGQIKTAEVNKIYRQRNENYRKAVEDLSNGDVKGAFEKLIGMEAIQDIDPLKPNEALVKDFTNTVKKGKTALIISPTHHQSEEVTGDIRHALRNAGVLGKKEITATRLVNRNLTEAERSDWRNINVGNVIQFNQNMEGIQRGSRWKVEECNDRHILIRSSKNETQLLPTNKSAFYDVYREKSLDLARGDLVRITRNGFDDQTKRLNNGQLLQVSSVKKSGDIELINTISKATYKINKDFGHVAHAYCITSHASQGKTVDEVFISQPAATFPATDAKQLYVSVSRGRDRARIYTDDKEELLSYAQRIGDRQSALELMRKRKQVEELASDNVRRNLQKPKFKAPVTSKKSKPITKGIDYEPGI